MMTDEQLSKLRDILTREARRLYEIDQKYGELDSKEILLNYQKKRFFDEDTFFARHFEEDLIALKKSNISKDESDKLIDFFDSLRNRFPREHEYLYSTSLLLNAVGQTDDAIDALEAALKIKPNRLKYLEQLAEYHKQREEYSVERRIYENVASMLTTHRFVIDSPKTAFHLIKTQIKIGDIYQRTENKKAAIKVYQETLAELDQFLEHPFSEEQVKQYYDEVAKLCGYCDSATKDASIATEQSRLGIELATNLLTHGRSIPNLERAYSAHWNAAFYADEADQKELAVEWNNDAIDIAEEAVQQDPLNKHLSDLASLILNQAGVFIDLKSFPQAKKAINQGIKIGERLRNQHDNAEKLARSYVILADYHIYRQNYPAAIKVAQKSIATDIYYKEDAETTIALAHLLTGKLDKAQKIFVTYKDKKYKNRNNANTDRKWNDILLEEIQELRKAGILHTDLAKVSIIFEVHNKDAQTMCSGLIEPDTLMGDTNGLALRCSRWVGREVIELIAKRTKKKLWHWYGNKVTA